MDAIKEDFILTDCFSKVPEQHLADLAVVHGQLCAALLVQGYHAWEEPYGEQRLTSKVPDTLTGD